MALISDLSPLNSLTKYPSIPTYHILGERGRLTEATVDAPSDTDLFYSEKIDGTNTRIVIAAGEATIVGSREEFLWAHGDLIHNPMLGIVDCVRSLTTQAHNLFAESDELVVLYGEVYGGKVGKAARSYSASGAIGFRLFDAIRMPIADAQSITTDPIESISHWRESGSQPFVGRSELESLASQLDVETSPLLRPTENQSPLPVDTATGAAWLQMLIPESQCALDDTGSRRPEGVVVRNADRSFIAKIRCEDYERTNRKR